MPRRELPTPWGLHLSARWRTATHVREVLKLALVRQPEPVVWDEAAEEAAALMARQEPASTVAH